ncbi:MAG: MFS transporter [Acidimicrobiales bacterium]|nr:MAG: MFS transporter [Acidimicrobiales bacterium]
MNSRRRSSKIALAAVSVGFMIVVLDAAALSVAIPDIKRAFGGSLASVQWVSNAYVVTFAGFMLSAGRVADRWGAKRTLLAGVAAFTITSVLCAVSPNISVLIVFRFLQGTAGAVLVTSAFSLIAHVFPGSDERAHALAMLNLCGSIGLTSGPLLAGVLVDTLSWRWVFLLNIVTGAFVALGLRLVSNPDPQRRLSVDIAGQILSVLSLGGLATALIEGRALGWTAPLTITGALVFIVAGIAFIAVERRRIDPMLPLSLFRTRSFTAGSVAVGVWRGSLYGLLFFLAFYFQHSHGFSSTLTGVAFIPITVTPLVSNYFSGSGIARWGSRFVAISGFAISAVGAGILFIASVTSGDYWLIGIALGLIGFGGGWAMPAVGHAALFNVPQQFSGIAAGVFNACGQTGALIGVALLGSLASGNAQLDLGTGATAVGALLVLTAVLLRRGLTVRT